MTLPWIDQETVDRAQGGDEAAYAALYEALRAPIQSHLYRQTWDWALAEDLAADAWLKVWQGLPRTSRAIPLRFVPWLYRIVGNRLRDHYRHAALVAWAPWDEKVEDRQVGPDDALGTVLDAEAEAQVRALLDALPPLHRDVLLPLGDGRSRAERAARCGLTEETFKNRQHRAREAFRKAYAAANPGTRPPSETCPPGVVPVWSVHRRAWRYHACLSFGHQYTRHFGTYDTLAEAAAVVAWERAQRGAA